MLGASVAALLLATPAMAGEGDDDEGCSRNSTVITCNEYFGWQNGEGGPFGWGVHADEVADGIATTAVNATNLEGNFSSHGPLIEIRQNGDVAVTTSGGNWTEQWLEVAGDTGTFTLQQIKDVAAGDANAPDDEGIETLFSSLDTDNDGIITTETLFHFFATEWVGEALGHGDGGVEQERASLEQVRRMLPDYVSEADRNAFLATLEVDANGTVEVASTTVAVTQFISERSEERRVGKES